MKYIICVVIVVIAATKVYCDDCSIDNFNITWQHTALGKLRHARIFDNNLGEANIMTITPKQRIPKICQHTFSKIPNINFLFLNSSGIEEIEGGSFINTKPFAVIDLNENNLTKIDRGVFNGLKIKILKLKHNKIEEIHSDAFDNMTNLLILDLSLNEIVTIPVGLFKNSSRIYQLYLENNRIRTLNGNIFSNLKREQKNSEDKLLSIYLEYNEIEFIDVQAFNGLDDLHILSLYGNRITILNGDTFSTLNHIDVVLFKNNSIECISNSLNFLNKIDKVVLHDNRWNCACLEDLQQYYDENDLDMSHVEDLECI